LRVAAADVDALVAAAPGTVALARAELPVAAEVGVNGVAEFAAEDDA
jgi:hypothetical protein